MNGQILLYFFLGLDILALIAIVYFATKSTYPEEKDGEWNNNGYY